MKRLTDLSFIALLSAGLLACSSQKVQEATAEETPSDSQELVVAQPAKDVTCRNIKATGSHMVRRVCMTNAEKAAQAESSKEWLRTRGASGGPTKVLDPDDPRNR